METAKLYILEQHDELKGFVVADNISEAMKLFQLHTDRDTVCEEFYRDFVVISNAMGRADYLIEVRENYKGTSGQRGMSAAIVAETYEVFELDFVMGRVYGTI